MAALSATRIGDRVTQDRYVERTVQVTTGAAAADEWITAADLGMTELVAVVGVVTVGTATSATLPSIVLNAQGTGVAAGTNPGDLGIENTLAGTFQVTVRGFI